LIHWNSICVILSQFLSKKIAHLDSELSFYFGYKYLHFLPLLVSQNQFKRLFTAQPNKQYLKKNFKSSGNSKLENKGSTDYQFKLINEN